MPAVTANGIKIEYEQFGKKKDPAVLFINGLGQQLIAWDDALIKLIVNNGYRVVCFDNRDVGLSAKMDGEKCPDLRVVALMSRLGIRLRIPYTLDDMALDAVCLLDALAIDKAHLVGGSMGGMIAQIAASRYQQKVKSLTCLCSSSGNPRLPRAKKEVSRKMQQLPKNLDREEWYNYLCDILLMVGGLDLDRQKISKRILSSIERSFYPEGRTRQYCAVLQSGSRVELLKKIEAPTLVINGALDPLVPYQAGEDIASNVQNGRFVLIEEMGHSPSEKTAPRLVKLVLEHLDKHR